MWQRALGECCLSLMRASNVDYKYQRCVVLHLVCLGLAQETGLVRWQRPTTCTINLPFDHSKWHSAS